MARRHNRSSSVVLLSDGDGSVLKQTVDVCTVYNIGQQFTTVYNSEQHYNSVQQGRLLRPHFCKFLSSYICSIPHGPISSFFILKKENFEAALSSRFPGPCKQSRGKEIFFLLLFCQNDDLGQGGLKSIAHMRFPTLGPIYLKQTTLDCTTCKRLWCTAVRQIRSRWQPGMEAIDDSVGPRVKTVAQVPKHV